MEHGTPVRALGWSPNGSVLAAADDGGMIRLWNPRSGEPGLQLLDHEGPVDALAWSPSGDLLASAGSDATVRLWDPGSGVLQVELRGHSKAIYALAWSWDGCLVASAGGDGAVRVAETSTGTTLGVLEVPAPVVILAWSPNGQHLTVGRSDGVVQRWQLVDWSTIRLADMPEADVATPSPDGILLASAAHLEGTITIFDRGAGSEAFQMRPHRDNVWALAWAPDGAQIGVGRRQQ